MIVGAPIQQAETQRRTRVEHKALGGASWRSNTTSQWINISVDFSSHQAITLQALEGLSTRRFYKPQNE